MSDLLDRLEALEREAEAGPWHLVTNQHPETTGEPWGAVETRRHPAGGAGVTLFTWSARRRNGASYENAALIAESRNALRRLLDVVRAAERGVWETDICGVTRCSSCRSVLGNEHGSMCRMPIIHRALDALNTETP